MADKKEDFRTTRELSSEIRDENLTPPVDDAAAVGEQEEKGKAGKVLLRYGGMKYYDSGEVGDLPGCPALMLPSRVQKINVRSSCKGDKYEIDVTREILNQAELLGKRLVIEFSSGEKNLIVFD